MGRKDPGSHCSAPLKANTKNHTNLEDMPGTCLTSIPEGHGFTCGSFKV